MRACTDLAYILCSERKETVTEHSRKPTPPGWLSDESMYRPGLHRNQEMRKDIQTNIYASESKKKINKRIQTNNLAPLVGKIKLVLDVK